MIQKRKPLVLKHRACLVASALALYPCLSILALGDDWQPVSAEELKMTSEPKAPGAPAIYLYRQVDRDDGRNAHEVNYARIKILTEEGGSTRT